MSGQRSDYGKAKMMNWDRNRGRSALVIVAVLLGALAAWLWAGNISASQGEERSDLDIFLDASSAGWAEVTSQFFTVPEAAAETIGALSFRMETTEEQLSLLLESIRRSDNLDAAYLGYPDGTFLFVGRSDEVALDGFRTRVISFVDGQRNVQLSWTDRNFRALRSDTDEDDVYDPTARPWYEPIAVGADRHWTEPYLFSSSKQPGITHSMAVRNDAGELLAVVGIDMRLTEVNGFLERLRPGDNGTALVVDDNGHVIAESSMEPDGLDETVQNGEFTLDQSPELQALVEQLEADPTAAVQGRSPDGTRTTIVRPAGARDEWYLAVRALDEDFLSNASATDVFGIFAVGMTTAAIAAGAGLLVLRYLVGLRREAETDELTGIYNRRAVKRELSGLLERATEPIHVAIIDLDEFKTINDTRGHAAGDAVLRVIAARLSEFCEVSGAISGRLGGDEFVVFGEGASPDWSQLNANLARPVLFEGDDLVVTASIGVTTSEHGDDPATHREVEDFFRAADRVLFQAKRHGGDSFKLDAAAGPGSTPT